jgi:hypothetical protein
VIEFETRLSVGVPQVFLGKLAVRLYDIKYKAMLAR